MFKASHEIYHKAIQVELAPAERSAKETMRVHTELKQVLLTRFIFLRGV